MIANHFIQQQFPRWQVGFLKESKMAQKVIVGKEKGLLFNCNGLSVEEVQRKLKEVYDKDELFKVLFFLIIADDPVVLAVVSLYLKNLSNRMAVHTVGKGFRYVRPLGEDYFEIDEFC